MESISKKLSGIELYYSPLTSVGDKKIIIQGEETRHILKVMRHMTGDEIYITNGIGTILKAIIKKTSDEIVEVGVIEEYYFHNDLSNIYFCLPRLRIPDRFEMALEKSTELGITHFIIYNSERSIPKGNKRERWEKILISAMKQSLRSFLPDLIFIDSFLHIKSMNGIKIVFLQEAEQFFDKSYINQKTKYYFIFGPEGDFTNEEKNSLNEVDKFNLGHFRLRTETAIIKCASLL